MFVISALIYLTKKEKSFETEAAYTNAAWVLEIVEAIF